MDTLKLSTTNVVDYKKNIELKKQIGTLDFDKALILLKKLNITRSDISTIIPKEINRERMLIEKEDDLFNLKGKVRDIKSQIIKEIEFDDTLRMTTSFRIVIKEEISIDVKFTSIKTELFQNIHKFLDGNITYLTNLKFVITEGIPFFINTLGTKVFVNNVSFQNYEANLLLPNKKNVTTICISKYNNLIDITKMNEGEYIDIFDSIQFNNLTKKLTDEMKDIGKLLTKNVKQSIYGITNNSNLNHKLDLVSICGIITSINQYSIEIVSLNDSHKIQIRDYKNGNFSDLRKNIIIFVKNANRRITNNYDIILCKPRNILILGILRNEYVINLRKFRYNKTRELESIIDLTQPCVVRTINKVILNNIVFGVY
jgi:hypothetical protein